MADSGALTIQLNKNRVLCYASNWSDFCQTNVLHSCPFYIHSSETLIIPQQQHGTNSVSDDNDDEDSMQVLDDLEMIDDDCDKHGIQFVKIDDDSAAKEFGIDDVPALVYFEKGIPNVYDGK